MLAKASQTSGKSPKIRICTPSATPHATLHPLQQQGSLRRQSPVVGIEDAFFQEMTGQEQTIDHRRFIGLITANIASLFLEAPGAEADETADEPDGPTTLDTDERLTAIEEKLDAILRQLETS